MSWSYLLITLLNFVIAEIRVPGNNSRVWTYDDEKSWPGYKCQEGGGRQSPIDIRSEDIVEDYQNTFIKHGPLKFMGFKRVLMTGINNGLTIQFSTDGERLIHPVLSGGPLAHTYRLEQVHFHWISEHAINGHKYPMEIHFVHVRTDLSVGEALKQRDGLAIIALFCTVHSILTEEQEDQISEIMEVIPHLLTTGDRVSGVLFNLMKLIRPNTESYLTYAGSLTSPECNEVVIWILFEAPIHISDSQYRLFGKIGISRHNFRSLQPLHHHVVYKPKPNSIWKTPVIARYYNEFVGTVAQFFKNMTRKRETSFVRRRMLKS